jgi:DNA-binding Lrp family transcriptional regulator
MRAYILINVVGGNIPDVVEIIRAISSIQEVGAVTGPYEIIAVASGNDIDEIMNPVLREIQKIDGITRTISCFELRS